MASTTMTRIRGHGYVRDRNGAFTTIDVPGATLTRPPGAPPVGGRQRFVGPPAACFRGRRCRRVHE
jgi:hypothetical protein